MNVSVAEISKRLADRAEEVCRILLPGGKSHKGEWQAGDVSGSPGDSLKVHLTGNHAGHWVDWANQTEHKGDLLDLWRFAKGLTAADAIKEAKDFLGIAETVFREKRVYTRAPDDAAAGVKPLDPNGKAMQFLVQKRKLEPAVVNRYRVTGKHDGTNGAIVFPCYDPQGNLVNRSYRTLPRNGEKKEVWQDKGCAPALFGWHALPDSAYTTRTVLLCEGQIDCMTWAMWGINALSIPNGSGGTWLEYEIDNLAAFDNIYISFDMDGAGRANSEKTIARLGRHRCLVVEIPKKDANDCLLAGYTAADAQRWIESAAAPKVEGLVFAEEVEKRLIAEITPKPEPFTLPFFKIEWPYEGLYFRPGEVTTWTGVSGNGKSTFLRYLNLGVVFGGKLTSFVATMEVKIERELSKMMTAASSKDTVFTERHVRIFLDSLQSRLLFADTVGYIKREKLLEMMWFAFQRHGATQFFIDSMMRIDGLEEDYPAQGQFLGELQNFAKTTGGHVHMVAHPRKTTDGAKLTKQDIKGSSLILNNTDNLVVISRNAEKIKLMREGAPPHEWEDLHDTEILVEKQRDSGWEGVYHLKFDPRRYTFQKCEPPSYRETPEPKPRKKAHAPYKD
jgi:twinkle protein